MPHFETEHTAADGQKLYCQAWIPEEYKAGVLILHGLAEHSGRYAHVAEALNAAGYAVYTFDGRGHGKSAEGGKPQGYVESYEPYFKDIDALLKKAQGNVEDKPFFLIGHSMGGALAADYTIRYQPQLSGVLLSGAAVKPGDDVTPFIAWLTKFLSGFLPKLAVSPVASSSISRHPDIVASYDTDPLNYRGGTRVRTGAGILSMMDHIRANGAKISQPILIMHGTADKITSYEGSQLLHDLVSSNDKTLKFYDGLYHEIMNEPERDEVIADMIAWMDARL